MSKSISNSSKINTFPDYKAYYQKIEKLSDEEVNATYIQIKSMVEVWEKLFHSFLIVGTITISFRVIDLLYASTDRIHQHDDLSVYRFFQAGLFWLCFLLIILASVSYIFIIMRRKIMIIEQFKRDHGKK